MGVDWQRRGLDSKRLQLANAAPECKDPSALYVESNRASVLHLLRRSEVDLATEHWSAAIEGAYQRHRKHQISNHGSRFSGTRLQKTHFVSDADPEAIY